MGRALLAGWPSDVALALLLSFLCSLSSLVSSSLLNWLRCSLSSLLNWLRLTVVDRLGATAAAAAPPEFGGGGIAVCTSGVAGGGAAWAIPAVACRHGAVGTAVAAVVPAAEELADACGSGDPTLGQGIRGVADLGLHPRAGALDVNANGG